MVVTTAGTILQCQRPGNAASWLARSSTHSKATAQAAQAGGERAFAKLTLSSAGNEIFRRRFSNEAAVHWHSAKPFDSACLDYETDCPALLVKATAAHANALPQSRMHKFLNSQGLTLECITAVARAMTEEPPSWHTTAPAEECKSPSASTM